MTKTPVQTLSTLKKAGGLVVGDILSHVMDASTVDMPPLPRFLPFNLPPPPFPHMPALRTPSPHHSIPGERPLTRSHSIGEKSNCHGRKWFEDRYSVKQNINVPHPSRKWFLRTTIGSQIKPVCEEGKTISCLEYFILLLPPNQFR